MTYYGKIVHVGEKDRKEGARGERERERERERDGRTKDKSRLSVCFIHKFITYHHPNTRTCTSVSVPIQHNTHT